MVGPGDGGCGGLFAFPVRTCGEVDVEEEDSALERGVGGAEDGGLPVEGVVAHGPGTALAGRVIADVLQFFVDSFQGHDLL